MFYTAGFVASCTRLNVVTLHCILILWSLVMAVARAPDYYNENDPKAAACHES